MNRRQILHYTAFLSGAAISAPLLSSVMTGCQNDLATNTDSDPIFFSKKQLDMIQKMIDIILPRTDSPSASDVGVHRVIDHMVGQVYQKNDRDEYLQKLEILFTYISSSDGMREAIAHIEDPQTSTQEAIRDAYQVLKQQAIAYYLSTEEIGKKYLNYLPVPGDYHACITLSEAGGKKWAI